MAVDVLFATGYRFKDKKYAEMKNSVEETRAWQWENRAGAVRQAQAIPPLDRSLAVAARKRNESTEPRTQVSGASYRSLYSRGSER